MSKNIVKTLINQVRAFKASITANDVDNGQAYYSTITHIQKNLKPLMRASSEEGKHRGIRNLSEHLEKLINATGESLEKKQQKIQSILNQAHGINEEANA